MNIGRRILCVIVIAGSIVGTAQSGQVATLQPCESAAAMSSFDLELVARLSSQLGLGTSASGQRGRYILQVLVLPDFEYGRADSPPEWVIAIFLPDVGNAALELKYARSSIRGANTDWVQVSGRPGVMEAILTQKENQISIESHAHPLARELAMNIYSFIVDRVASARFQEIGEFELHVHATEYLFLVRRGATICAQSTFSSEGEADDSLYRVVELLRDLVLAEKIDEPHLLEDISVLLGQH